MSLLNQNKKQTRMKQTSQVVNEQPKADERPFDIIVTMEQAKQLDAYLQNVPHGIAMNIVNFFASCKRVYRESEPKSVNQ